MKGNGVCREWRVALVVKCQVMRLKVVGDETKKEVGSS